MHRRALMLTLTGAAIAPVAALAPRICVATADGAASDFERDLAALERSGGGRLGVAAIDPATGTVRGHRLDERFALCSTFKLLLAAQVLERVERGEESLSRRVAYARADLVEWSPDTEPGLVAGGMDVASLCRAAIAHSDNSAANLLLRESGGPAAMTAFVRTLGDEATRLDGIEPGMNDWAPGQVENTTTPRAMAVTVRALVAGGALAASSRATLRGWLRGSDTGGKRLRAGLPRGWDVGDKTGTWRRQRINDVAVAGPAGASPWVVAAYLSAEGGVKEVKEATLGEVGRLVGQLARPRAL